MKIGEMELNEEQQAMVAILGAPETLAGTLAWRPVDGLEITSSEGGFEVNGVAQSFHGALECLPKGRVPEHKVAGSLRMLAEQLAPDDWWSSLGVHGDLPEILPPACKVAIDYEGSTFGVVWDEHFRWAAFFGGGPFFWRDWRDKPKARLLGFGDKRLYEAMRRAHEHQWQDNALGKYFEFRRWDGVKHFQVPGIGEVYSVADRLTWVGEEPAYGWCSGKAVRGDLRGVDWETKLLPRVMARQRELNLRDISWSFARELIADRNARIAALEAEAAPDEKQGPPRSDEDSCDEAQHSDEFDRQIVDFFARYLDRVMPPDVPEARGVKNSLVSALRWSVGALGFFAGAGAVFAHHTIKKVSGNE